MSTGGGWQDQVGGLTGGIKLVSTKPGLMQNIEVQHLNIPEEALQELKDRFVLFTPASGVWRGICSGRWSAATSAPIPIPWRCSMRFSRWQS